MGKGIGAFIAGGIIGAGIALLYAPRPGAETRAIVSDKVGETWGQAQDLGAQASANVQQFYHDAAAKGQEVVENVAAKGQKVYEGASTRVQEAASNVKPVFSEKNDELRDKIEAARARIASQVAKNAEAAQDTMSETIPVAADAVEDVVVKAEDPAKAAVDVVTEESE